MHASHRLAALAAAAILSSTSVALAHVTLAGPGYAGQSQVLTFSVAHGCSGADTYQLEVMIPKEVTTVRALPSAFGEAQVKTDDAGLVTSVVWAKAKDQVHPQDDMYYQMSIRIAVPNTPFTTLLFPAVQSCRAADGTESTVNWDKSPEEVKAAGGGEDVPPSPSLALLPVRQSGWNKYTVAGDLDDLSIFNDAQIVWSGDAAYSGNTATTELIGQTAGVSVLSKIEAGADVWVKY
jgi:uncharacterized protein YcnI